MIGNLGKWKAAPQALRAPEGVEGGFERCEVAPEVMEFVEYLGKSIELFKIALKPTPYYDDASGETGVDLSILNPPSSGSLAGKTFVQMFFTISKVCENENIIDTDRVAIAVMRRIHKRVSNSILVAFGQEVTENVSKSSQKLSEEIWNSDKTFRYIQSRLWSFAVSAVKDEKRLLAIRGAQLKISHGEISGELVIIEKYLDSTPLTKGNKTAPPSQPFFADRPVEGAEQEFFAEKGKSLFLVVHDLIRKEKRILPANSKRLSVLLAVEQDLKARTAEIEGAQKEAAEYYGVSEDIMRALRRDMFRWARLMYFGFREGPMLVSHEKYIMFMRNNLDGPRSEWREFQSQLVKIEEYFSFGRGEIDELINGISQKSNFSSDDIMKKLWLKRMKFISTTELE